MEVTYPILLNVEGRTVFDPYAIKIGTTAEGKPFAYNPRYVVNPLVLIVGTPGAGKSATVKTIIHSLMGNQLLSELGDRVPPIIVVDPEGEYGILKHLAPDEDSVLIVNLGRGDYINIFDRPSKMINPFVWYARIQAVLQEFLDITPAQAPQAYRVLSQAINELARHVRKFSEDPRTWFRDDITLEELYRYIETQYIQKLEEQQKLKRKERVMLQGATTVAARLKSWMIPPNDAFSRKSTVRLSDFFKYKLIILNARGLESRLYGLFTQWLVYWMYGYLLEKGPLPSFGLRVVLIIDEAWALLQKKSRKREENPLEGLARRGRKYGILLIVATQTPDDVDRKMFSLFGTLATGVIPSDEMVKKIVESRGMPESFITVIKRLPRGSLVWSINWANKNFVNSGMPIIVKTDYPVPPLVQIQNM